MGDPGALFLAGDLAGAVAAAPPGSALAAVARGGWPEALAAAGTALAARPGDPLALWCRATARLGLGDRQGALADWTTLVERAPASGVGWKDRAVLRALLGDREGALSDLAQAADRAEDDVVPHLWAWALGGGPGELRAFVRAGGWAGRLAALLLREVRVDALLTGLEADALPEAERLRRRCQLHGYAGLLAEQGDDAPLARAHYEACVATEVWTFLTHLWARERLVDLALRGAG